MFCFATIAFVAERFSMDRYDFVKGGG